MSYHDSAIRVLIFSVLARPTQSYGRQERMRKLSRAWTISKLLSLPPNLAPHRKRIQNTAVRSKSAMTAISALRCFEKSALAFFNCIGSPHAPKLQAQNRQRRQSQGSRSIQSTLIFQKPFRNLKFHILKNASNCTGMIRIL